MSLFLRNKPLQNHFLRRLNWKNFANDSTKTSVASSAIGATSSTSATATPIAGKPIISVPPKPVKVNLEKPNMNLVVDTTTIRPHQSMDDIAKAISFDNIPGPISLKIIHKIWGMVPLISTQITGGAIQYLLAVGQPAQFFTNLGFNFDYLGSLLSWSGNMALFKRVFDHCEENKIVKQSNDKFEKKSKSINLLNGVPNPCVSCGGTDHQRSSNKKCPNYEPRKSLANKAENTKNKNMQ